MECLAVIGAVCLLRADRINFTPQGPGRQATAYAGAATIEITINSDNLTTIDARRAARGCQGAICIAYYKHCEPVKGGDECRYGFAGLPYWPLVTITAPTPAGIEAAEQAIAIIPGRDVKAVVVPFSKLTARGASDHPPMDRPARP
jgi:hypothetical protein